MWLKRRTPQNIVIGGAAGAFPPMIGWAAVTGDVSARLAGAVRASSSCGRRRISGRWRCYRAGDYARAGVPMLPVVAGVRETKRQILLYTLVLLPVSLAPSRSASPGWSTRVGAGVLGLILVAGAVARVARRGRDGRRKRLFGYSILYLFLLFALLMFDQRALRGCRERGRRAGRPRSERRARQEPRHRPDGRGAVPAVLRHHHRQDGAD